MQKKYTYKNKTDQPQTLIGHGQVMPGDSIDTDEEVNNPNFELSESRRLVGVEGPVEQPDPNERLTGKESKNKSKK